MSAQGAWGYRPALDGVRALAVTVVVLFHAGVGAAAGGFIGVDLFFVLSGYLVTTILMNEMETTGTIQLRRFYARRIRRLLPAAIVVVVVVSGVYVLVAPITSRLDLVGDARAALLYVSNWHFVARGQDYFAAHVGESPFLHFWSLSIEEQFYFVFPVLLIGLFRLRGRLGPLVVPAGLGLLCAASLAMQGLWAATDVERAYYGTEARFYQLALGALCAVLARRLPGRVVPGPVMRLLPWAAAGGCVILATSLVDLTPSARGVVAALLAVALIGGLERSSAGAMAALFSRPAMVSLGRISYGTYLWHWPVILVAGMLLDVDPVIMAVLALVVSNALAFSSAKLLELPIRRSPRLDGMPRSVVATGLACSVLVAVAIPVVLESRSKPVLAAVVVGREASKGAGHGSGQPDGGVAASRAAGVAAARAALGPVPVGIDWKAVRSDIPTAPDCSADRAQDCIVHAGAGPTILLVGDSTARTLVPVLTDLAREHDFTLAAKIRQACSWYIGARRVSASDDEACVQGRERWYPTALDTIGPDVLILHHRAYRGERWEDELRAVDPEIAVLPLEERQAALATRTLDLLTDLVPAIIVIEPAAAGLDFDPTKCLASADDIAACTFTLPGPEPIESFLRERAHEDPAVDVVDLDGIVCPESPLCIPYRDGMVVWRDETHVATGFWRSHADQPWEALTVTGRFD